MAKTLLSLQDVHVRRGMNTVLQGCSLQVDSGQTVVLTGANGTGKSTLLEAAVGLLPLENGTVVHGEGTVLDLDVTCLRFLESHLATVDIDIGNSSRQEDTMLTQVEQ